MSVDDDSIRPAAPHDAGTPAMVEVRFRPGGALVWVRSGTGLVEAGEAAGVDIVVGCTRGECGTDPVRIERLEPADALSEVGERERATLERMGLEPDDGWRLACSTRVLRGVVEVDVEAF